MDGYLRVGVVLQVPDQAGAEFSDIVLDLSDVVPKTVQLCHDDLVTVGAAVAVAPGDQRPSHDDHQDTDGSDDLGQASEVFHLFPNSRGRDESGAIVSIPGTSRMSEAPTINAPAMLVC